MRFIDLFCGMGTIRMGFEQAGHECVYAVEWDKHKRRIYEIIFGHEPQGRDITDTRTTDFPAADCWCFGAPCQDFSIAGLREGMEGDRSSLVREVFRLVRETPEEHRPEWLLYENVKGMLSSNKGFDYLEILFEMASLGYDIEYQLLNSKDFGVPQNRERVYTLGHLRRYGERKIFPFAGQSNEYSTIGKSAKTAVARTLTGGGHSGGNHSGMTILCYNHKQAVDGVTPVFKDISPCLISSMYKEPPCIQVVANIPASREQRGRVYGSEGISPALDTCQGGGKVPIVATNPIRRLTPRECMRLQGVPDYITDKLIQEGISDTQIYRASGDACTVNVIYEIAKRLEC